MSDAFKNVQIDNLGTIGEDAKSHFQFMYDKAEKKYETDHELEGGIGTLKAMVSGKKLGEAIENRVGPVIKRHLQDEVKAFKDRWVNKAKGQVEKVLKPKATTQATADTQTEGNLLPDLSSVSEKSKALLNKAESVQGKLTKLNQKGREIRATSKEQQADKLEEEMNKTESLAREAGFKNATTDKDIPLEVRQAGKAKYAKMGKLRDEAKQLRRQNQAEANEEQVKLNDSQPVSSQGNSQVTNANADDTATADANALGKAQIKSGVGDKPDNTPQPKGKGKGEEEEGAEGEEATVGDDVAETVMEGLGQALDDTGILAPIGLLLGGVGIGLGASKKGAPVEMTDRDNENSYSYQVGIN